MWNPSPVDAVARGLDWHYQTWCIAASTHDCCEKQFVGSCGWICCSRHPTGASLASKRVSSLRLPNARAQCISLFVCVRTVPSSVIHNTTRTSPIPVALAIPGSQRITRQLPRVVNSNNACLSCPASEDHTTCRRPYVSIAHCWHQPTDALLSFSRFWF